jgi:hypothetical protein
MPKLLNRAPAYRLHRGTGQAFITIDGKDIYLGVHGTKASRAEYDRIIGLWLANGRHLPGMNGRYPDLSCNELAVRYLKFADEYYRRDGAPTREPQNIRVALGPLKRLYGSTLAADFGPLSLRTLRSELVALPTSRAGAKQNPRRWAGGEQSVGANGWGLRPRRRPVPPGAQAA